MKYMQSSYQTLKGFRDFLPAEKRARDFVADKIKETFTLFGFEPLETPTLEYADLLLGKYGSEADKLVYTFEDKGGRRIGLRYDQTVPTARVLAQYGNQLGKGFRRYQIQNVFRADKPQQGRYREFTQCDPDIFGSTSPIADAEIIAVTYFAFKNVGFKNIVLRLNDRQILFNTLENFATDKVPVLSIIQSIDKLDKISATDVKSELMSKGLTATKAQECLDSISSATISPSLQTILTNAISLGVPSKVLEFSPFLARGLDYYTGMIFEVIIPEYSVGSFGGGGRYDQLIETIGGPNTPAVGIAFGFDRMVEAAQQLDLIPTKDSGTKVLVTIFSPNLQKNSLQTAAELRKAGLNTEVYPDAEDKLAKQLKYASKKRIPYVIVIGDEESENNKVTLKDMGTGEQLTRTLPEIISTLLTRD